MEGVVACWMDYFSYLYRLVWIQIELKDMKRFFFLFVSTQMVYVVFITSEKMSTSWAALSEVGAAWITRKDHQIFNLEPFRPQPPLNVNVEWQASWRDPGNGGRAL